MQRQVPNFSNSTGFPIDFNMSRILNSGRSALFTGHWIDCAAVAASPPSPDLDAQRPTASPFRRMTHWQFCKQLSCHLPLRSLTSRRCSPRRTKPADNCRPITTPTLTWEATVTRDAPKEMHNDPERCPARAGAGAGAGAFEVFSGPDALRIRNSH